MPMEQALAYAERGWKVFPVWPRGKNPLTPNGFKDATTDAATIRRWWSRWPEANIGLVVPDGFIVVDVDSPDALRSLKAQSLVLPSTVSARTGRGFHFWYTVTDVHVKNAVGILPGIDIRTSGGYVIVPPSIHPSGASYRWKVPLEQGAISDCPEWLLDLLAQAASSQQGRSADEWLKAITEPVSKGRRNQTLAEVAGLLFRRLPASIAAELAICWARVKLSPPLPEREVMRTLDSIAGREVRRRAGT
jgi:hypothetical protein